MIWKKPQSVDLSKPDPTLVHKSSHEIAWGGEGSNIIAPANTTCKFIFQSHEETRKSQGHYGMRS